MDDTTRRMIDAATHYERAIRELRSEVAALRALTDNAWAQYRAAAIEDSIRHMDLIGKALEGVPTWSDITDKLRAEGK
jgi:hypothetical protein